MDAATGAPNRSSEGKNNFNVDPRAVAYYEQHAATWWKRGSKAMQTGWRSTKPLSPGVWTTSLVGMRPVYASKVTPVSCSAQGGGERFRVASRVCSPSLSTPPSFPSSFNSLHAEVHRQQPGAKAQERRSWNGILCCANWSLGEQEPLRGTDGLDGAGMLWDVRPCESRSSDTRYPPSRDFRKL